MLALVFGLATSSLSARLMTESDFGLYRFVISVVTVLAGALTLGLFSSAGVLLAGRGGGTFRKMVARGASTQAWLAAAGCTIGVGVALLANSAQANSYLWMLAALLGSAMVWPILLQEVLRARGNFVGLAVLNAAPTALFLLLLAASWLLNLALDVSLCATLYFFSQAFVVWVLVSRHGLALRPHRIAHAYLFKRNRNLGLNVYLGTFLAALTAQAGIFVLQGAKTPVEVAVFALAVTVTSPLTMLPSAVGTAYFSRLPGAPGFPAKVLQFAWVAVLIMGLIFYFAAPLAIHILYGERYASATVPAQLCGIAALLHGMGDVYNRYYLANRDTSFLLKLACIVCASAFLVGIPAGVFFGELGVSVARLIASGTYVFFLVYQYHIVLRRFGNKGALE
ncbi:lipopolysaccharide biosynthesis protein [Azonexus sp.]|uniref:lipopolysaccharide biosynthesis protein n=1 Tax=Azonexus sp. TaxID=1872668 RepID=UPI0035AE03BA